MRINYCKQLVEARGLSNIPQVDMQSEILFNLLIGVSLKEDNFEEANLEGAYGLSLEQLSKVKTLY